MLNVVCDEASTNCRFSGLNPIFVSMPVIVVAACSYSDCEQSSD